MKRSHRVALRPTAEHVNGGGKVDHMRDADVGGYLLAVADLGVIFAALFMASFGFIFDKGKVVLGAAVATSITCFLFAFSHWMVMAFIVIAAMAFSQVVFRTSRDTLIQTLAPDRLRGRLTSCRGRPFTRPFGPPEPDALPNASSFTTRPNTPVG